MKKVSFRKSALFFLTLSAWYLYALPAPNIFYIGTSLAHVFIGVVAAFLFAWAGYRSVRARDLTSTAGWSLIVLGAVTAFVLIFIGATRPHKAWLYAHIAFSVAGVLVLIVRWLATRWPQRIFAVVSAALGLVLLTGALAGLGYYTRVVRWNNANRIHNPNDSPVSMDAEGGGPNGRFFPSSSQTRDGKLIPAKYFMESKACERCHKDIYDQWNSSAHHRSSFNNQWYRKSIEYMQDVVGTKPSKWCGGCHDPAVLYSGLMDTPIKQIVNRPEAHAGLGCLMCHSIVQVNSTMGQGDFILEYPKMHELAASKNPVVQWLHDASVYLNPEPHRRAFLKPFMTQQPADFCSSCHKVHLDVPVNHYRWVRGFNDYDNWQASGVSGMGARSFYYPPKSMRCVDCHMPLIPSKDDGNRDGFIRSHRFPGANTALPTAYEDQKQLDVVRNFLKSGIVSVDIFAVSPEKQNAKGSASSVPGELSTNFAVGEEAESNVPVADESQSAASTITAPLDRVLPALPRGGTERVDVVVRTRKVGHFFPGGTVDAFDVWVEFKATDENGRVLFWSGKVDDDGRGPVDREAHFYKSLTIDAHGNAINKRNAWAGRALVYVRLIPPGAADTVHYRLRIPPDAGKFVKLEAKVNYRKFSWYNTQFSYAGQSAPPSPAMSPDYDDRPMTYRVDPKMISGKVKDIPVLPITVIAQQDLTLPIGPAKSAPAPLEKLQSDDWERWNDYGIGLFLQGDLKGAIDAFSNVARLDPKKPDGYVNMARAYIQEGENSQAKDVLNKAFALAPNLARTHYFYSRVLRAEGDYKGAIEHLKIAAAQYPRDRVVRDDLGRLYFLERKYNEAVAEFNAVLDIDPEDLQAQYNLMLCYNGLGQPEQAHEHQLRYLRFKADEAAQALTGPYRQAHPNANRERQPIHEHDGIDLSEKPRARTEKKALLRTPPVHQGMQ